MKTTDPSDKYACVCTFHMLNSSGFIVSLPLDSPNCVDTLDSSPSISVDLAHFLAKQSHWLVGSIQSRVV